MQIENKSTRFSRLIRACSCIAAAAFILYRTYEFGKTGAIAFLPIAMCGLMVVTLLMISASTLTDSGEAGPS